MGIFRLMIGSLYSAQAYGHMRRKASFGLGYSFMLVLVTTLVVTIYFSAYSYRELFAARDGKLSFLEDMTQQISAQVPLMTLHGGMLKTAEEKPTTIVLTGTAFGEHFEAVPFVTIDTSGSTDYNSTPAPIFISNKDIYIKSSNKTEIKSIAEFTENKSPSTLVITRSMASELAGTFTRVIYDNLLTLYIVFGGMLWLMAAMFMYVMRLAMVFAIGLIGLLIAPAASKRKVTYAESVSLAALAYTPIAVLDTVNFSLLRYPTSTLVLFAAGCVALFFAIRASDGAEDSVRIG